MSRTSPRAAYLPLDPPARVCTCCSVGIGQGYESAALREPYGAHVVCGGCWAFLRRTGQRVRTPSRLGLLGVLEDARRVEAAEETSA